MEALILALALLLGTALAIGMSMAGLQLIISFVNASDTERPEGPEATNVARPQRT